MALSEPMFTTSTAATRSIRTPSDSDVGIDPAIAVANETADVFPLVVDVGNKDSVDAERHVALEKRNPFIRVVKKASASAKKFARKTRSLTNVSAPPSKLTLGRQCLNNAI